MNEVTVLMSTFNGQKFLKQQIESILNQVDVKVRLIVRDDGSTDNTVNILKEFADQKKITYFLGKNEGAAHSFLDVLNSTYVDNQNSNMYFAFSDQDDIWKENKLSRAVEILNKGEYKDTPSLYAGSATLIDADGKEMPTSTSITTTNFTHSIVASYCTGCTMVFNKKLFDIIVGKSPTYLFMHDDWIHKVCLAVGGKVFYDSKFKGMYYRQHSNNVIGSQSRITDKIKKHYRRITVEKDCLLKEYIEIKNIYGKVIPMNNMRLINELINYKRKNLLERIKFVNRNYFKLNPNKFTRDFKATIILKCY